MLMDSNCNFNEPYMNKCTCGHSKSIHNYGIGALCHDCRGFDEDYDDCICDNYKRYKSPFRHIKKWLKEMWEGGETMTQYVLVDGSNNVVDTIYESLDEARDAVEEDYEGDEEGMRLFALGQEYSVILPSKKVLFKKKGTSTEE